RRSPPGPIAGVTQWGRAGGQARRWYPPAPSGGVMSDRPHPGAQRADDHRRDSPRGHDVQAEGLRREVGGQGVEGDEEGGEQDTDTKAQAMLAVLVMRARQLAGLELGLRSAGL